MHGTGEQKDGGLGKCMNTLGRELFDPSALMRSYGWWSVMWLLLPGWEEMGQDLKVWKNYPLSPLWALCK